MKEIKRWGKNRISYIHFGYGDFYDFDNFAIKLLECLKDNVRYSLLLKVNFNDDRYVMVGKQIGFKYSEEEYIERFDDLHTVYKKMLNSTLDNYEVEEVNSIQLLYVLIDDMPKLKIQNVNKVNFNNNFTNVKDSKDRFNIMPLTVNMHYFGKPIINSDDCALYLSKINEQRDILNKDMLSLDDGCKMHLYKDSFIILSIVQSGNTYYRGVYDVKSGVLINELNDIIVGDNHFVRKIGNVSLTIINDVIVKVESIKALSPIKFVPKSLKDESNPFIGSWDVEAFEDIDGYAKVYALGFVVLGQNSKMYYLDNGITSEQLVLQCLNDMLVKEYNGYTFYTHNFGKYDSIFLIKILKEENLRLGYEHYIIKELCRDGKILKLVIKVKKSLGDRRSNITGVRKDPGYNTITIVDSLNILNQSLADLCSSFEVPVTKGNFPYSFVKRDTLHYIGNTPGYNYWENLSKEDYAKLVKPDWSLKDECLTYLDKDLVSLVMIMNKFSEYINRKYYLQVTESLTISRLALNIFLKDYLKDSKLPIITKNMFNDIKQAYYGGVTEVYKPYGTNLLHYDVNSLYPFAALNPMPGINCSFIENLDKSLELNSLFGFFYCEVQASNNYLGLLPVHSKEGLIMPNGIWKGWYFSEELKYAAEKGYTIRVISGYNFNKVYNVFTDYVNDLYKIKSSTTDRVEKDIAKRLLNHLLGRFGLNIVKPITKCVNGEELSLLFSTREIIGKPVKITGNDYWVTYNSQIDKDICTDHGIDYIKMQNLTPKTDVEKLNEFRDVSLTTAAAVTAYSRVYMSKIKQDILDRGGNIYYTDTDSIVTDIPLDDSLVGDGLGMFKLEYQIKQGYYISNKTYYVDLAEKLWDKRTNKYISSVVKAKTVKNESLSLNSFENLYNNKNVEAIRRSAIKDYYKGSVLLVNESVQLKHNAYTKREKVYKGNLWVDTKPLVLGEDSKIKKKYNTQKVVWNSFVFSDLTNTFLSYLYGFGVLILTLTLQISDLDFELDCVNNQITSDLYPNLDEILELRYNDDYIEESVEIDIPVSEEKKSWVKDFLNLFMDRGYKPYSSYKDPSGLISYTDRHNNISGSLQNSIHHERPQVLNTVLKYQLDVLYDEITTLKGYYIESKIKELEGDHLIHDALNMCKKALYGSPPTGVNSPTLGINTSFSDSPLTGSHNQLLTRNSPLLTRNNPTVSNGTPLIDLISQFRNDSSPILNGYKLHTTFSPKTDINSPLLDRYSPLQGNSSPLLDKYRSLLSNNSPRVGNSSPLSNNDSPIVAKSSVYSGLGLQ